MFIERHFVSKDFQEKTSSFIDNKRGQLIQSAPWESFSSLLHT